MSKGLTRSRTDKLAVSARQRGEGALHPPRCGKRPPKAAGVGRRRRCSSHRAEAAGATALKAEPEAKLSPATAARALNWAEAKTPTPSSRGREARRGQRQGRRGRSLRRMRQLHAGAQRHLHEVRHVRVNDGVFVNTRSSRQPAPSSCAGPGIHDLSGHGRNT